ncbi:hypothetical protein Y1Q_0001369 [Alligator mississippiensis]|uniref:Uncharacterized protein n=1 Tax=Alligator mississippiensis TaxID=8496 RepID=A0A151M974_ALLMI|nr:hypothetical protein Y1Q_0001369 [Alligator mississippiensis]
MNSLDPVLLEAMEEEVRQSEVTDPVDKQVLKPEQVVCAKLPQKWEDSYQKLLIKGKRKCLRDKRSPAQKDMRKNGQKGSAVHFEDFLLLTPYCILAPWRHVALCALHIIKIFYLWWRHNKLRYLLLPPSWFALNDWALQVNDN